MLGTAQMQMGELSVESGNGPGRYQTIHSAKSNETRYSSTGRGCMGIAKMVAKCPRC